MKRKFIFLVIAILTCTQAFASEENRYEKLRQCLLARGIKAESPIGAYQTNDPLEPANRVIYKFNQYTMFIMIKKVGKVYEMVAPEFVRDRIYDFGKNSSMPARFINNILQGKFRNAFRELGRFLINTSFGLAGLFDVSKTVGMEAPPSEDLGQTMGYYGVGPGVYIVAPLLGPTNVRDLIGFVGDTLMDPLFYLTHIVPGIRIFIDYNEFMVHDRGKHDVRVMEIVLDDYYRQKSLYDLLRVALSCY